MKNYKKEFEKIVNETTEKVDFSKLKKSMQHGSVSTYEHCINVAYISFYIAKRYNIDVNYHELIRGALLHDYFLYDWHNSKESPKWHGYVHAKIALKNATNVIPDLTEKEKNIIYSHMWPLNLTHIPKTKEALIVMIADKISALHETILKRKKPS